MNLAMRKKRHGTLVLGVAGPGMRQQMQGGNRRHGIHGQKKDQAKCRQPAAGPFRQLHYMNTLNPCFGQCKQFFWVRLKVCMIDKKAEIGAERQFSPTLCSLSILDPRYPFRSSENGPSDEGSSDFLSLSVD